MSLQSACRLALACNLSSSGQQSRHPAAGPAGRRGSMDQGQHQLSPDKGKK